MRQLLLLFLLVTGISFQGNAQDSIPPLGSRNILKLSTLHLLGRTQLKIGIENLDRKLSSSFAVFVTGEWSGSKRHFVNFNERSGLAVETQFRHYFLPMRGSLNHKKREVAYGVYAMFLGKISKYQIDTKHTQFTPYGPGTTPVQVRSSYRYETEISDMSVGLCAGYQQRITKRLVFDAYAGIGKQWADVTYDGEYGFVDSYAYNPERRDPGFAGIVPRIGFLLGFTL